MHVIVFFNSNDNFIHWYIYNFKAVKCKHKEKEIYNMSLETEVTRGFLVSLQLLGFYRYLRQNKTIERLRYAHQIGEKEHIEISIFT